MRTHKSLKTAALSLGSLGVGLILATCKSPPPAPSTETSPATSASAGAGTSATAGTGTGLTQATATALANPTSDTPVDLAERLQQGGLVIVHRYSGATRPDNPYPAPEGFIDAASAFPNKAYSVCACSDGNMRHWESRWIRRCPANIDLCTSTPLRRWG